MLVYVFVRAVIAKYHRWSGLHNENNFLTVLEAGSPGLGVDRFGFS